MLERLGDEVARATSIVRYAPGSHFSPHVHTGGEEFVVLEGVFQDEHGDFPVGSYIRNPPSSSHTPGSKPGCVIFVKLWQFDLDDRVQVRTKINANDFIPDSKQPGVSKILLHQDEREKVTVETWQPGCDVTVEATGGAELLVLEGSVLEAEETLKTQSWLRVPVGSVIRAKAGSKGAKIWLKTGHLHHVQAPPT